MRTVFSGGQVFDGTGSAPATADVAVDDGTIAEVGSGLDGDEQVDASGHTILPGLFDCHTHIMFSHIDMWKLAQTPFSYMFFEAQANLKRTLSIGITTIRDAGGADLGVKKAVEDGLVPGPRMQISIKMISQTGGHGDEWLPSGAYVPFLPHYPGSPRTIVDGPDEMRRVVRELIRDGADVIKVATTGGVLSPRDDPRHSHFTPEELEMLVSEAALAGRWVMAHAQGANGIKNAIRAGIRSIDHGVYLDDEAIDLMLRNGTYLVATLVAPVGVVAAAEQGAQIPEASLQKAKETIEIHKQSFAKAVDAGVNIAMGTDSGVTPHGENLRELELMADGGMAPEAVLASTTSKAAALMGLEKELGTIEAGKRADLVLVEGDPFEFAKLADRITAVYKDGRRVMG